MIRPDEAKKLIDETTAAIRPLDGASMRAASEKMDGLLKPPGSLGRLEEIAIRLAGIQRTESPDGDRRLSLVYAGEHGVVDEGVSASPSIVNGIMVRAFCSGKAGISTLAERAGAVLKVIDVGVAVPYEEPENLIVRRVRPGTGNIRIEAAMSREEALQALATGIETAGQAIDETDATVAGIGEMGIGNTTPAAALTALFTNRDPATVTGGGTGLGEKGLKLKKRVVKDALELHKPDPSDPVGALSTVGGLEIAAMAGAMLAAASRGVLILIDGFISGSAALTATALAPEVRNYMILSHLSAEPGHRAIAAKLELKPLLDLGFRLGEGTGSAAAMPLVGTAAALLNQMGTLAEELVHLAPPE